MQYYSTQKKVPSTDLKTAILKGLADDNGLYMPQEIRPMPTDFFDQIRSLSFPEMAFRVAEHLFGEDIDAKALKEIVYDTLNFDIPLVHVDENRYSLELFHGPTMAFKDVGARFLARIMRYYTQGKLKTNVLVATSGDTGSAVANGFLGVEGITVTVLYPKGLVSKIQESQFTTLGQNIQAIEIEGTFDDCQRLVKTAFLDPDLKGKMNLSSANSINLARFIPQCFYYFWAYAQSPGERDIYVSVPSGNFGNLMAGLLAKKLGLPIHGFVAATNVNDIVPNYLETGIFTPRASVSTIANAMDVGNPSNFVRILDLYKNDWEAIKNDIKGYRYTDEQIRRTMRKVYKETGYILDPHGACAYQALCDHAATNSKGIGIFFETAHPAKFKETVDETLSINIDIPATLKAFMKGTKKSIELSNRYEDFKAFLLS